VSLSLQASTMRPMGRPMRRAMTQANALPRLPVGTMKDSARACWRQYCSAAQA